ncbi:MULTISPECIES: hypothetical protein [Burkholderia]|uniref:hypothetical protein n=1 Tax=Burkholderia TaxID=32008 RepID=UPI000841ABEC|nr:MULTISPECIES: hypothetical protein [unclassified Burkholderia]AOK28950.1 hypothetical protein AQ611_05410 [Burkholderia sp. Bp7605]
MKHRFRSTAIALSATAAFSAMPAPAVAQRTGFGTARVSAGEPGSASLGGAWAASTDGVPDVAARAGVRGSTDMPGYVREPAVALQGGGPSAGAPGDAVSHAGGLLSNTSGDPSSATIASSAAAAQATAGSSVDVLAVAANASPVANALGDVMNVLPAINPAGVLTSALNNVAEAFGRVGSGGGNPIVPIANVVSGAIDTLAAGELRHSAAAALGAVARALTGAGGTGVLPDTQPGYAGLRTAADSAISLGSAALGSSTANIARSAFSTGAAAIGSAIDSVGSSAETVLRALPGLGSTIPKPIAGSGVGAANLRASDAAPAPTRAGVLSR